MKARKFCVKAAFTAAIIVFLSATSPQDAFADNAWRSLVGSWVVEITLVPGPPGGPPPFENLATVHRDGTMVTSDPVIGGGHGAWKRSGKRDFEVKFLALLPPVLPADTLPPFLANTTVTVTAFLTVSGSGDEASGVVSAVYTDSGGIVVFSVEGTVSWTRIAVD